jgi:hypothetical protein
MGRTIRLPLLCLLSATAFAMAGCMPMSSAPAAIKNVDETLETPSTTPESAPSPTPKPRSAPSVGGATPLWESKHAQGTEWTAHVLNKLDTLGRNLLEVEASDATTICPRYASLSYGQKKQAWAFFISAIVRYESNFDPSRSYQESFRDSTGARVVSRGLLQLSLESSRAYSCGFASSQEIHDPFMNLSCGIKILNHWVGRDKKIAGGTRGAWKGGARYWAVLRTSSPAYSKIVALTKSTALCAERE